MTALCMSRRGALDGMAGQPANLCWGAGFFWTKEAMRHNFLLGGRPLLTEAENVKGQRVVFSERVLVLIACGALCCFEAGGGGRRCSCANGGSRFCPTPMRAVHPQPLQGFWLHAARSTVAATKVSGEASTALGKCGAGDCPFHPRPPPSIGVVKLQGRPSLSSASVLAALMLQAALRPCAQGVREACLARAKGVDV